MPALNVLIERGEVCRRLRAKTLFYQPVEPAESKEINVGASSALPDGPFWCARTQSLLGPDGEIVGAESCRPGRSCCETA